MGLDSLRESRRQSALPGLSASIRSAKSRRLGRLVVNLGWPGEFSASQSASSDSSSDSSDPESV